MLIIVFVIVYGGFIIWYGGITRPMDQKEINTGIDLLELQISLNGESDTNFISQLRTALSNDDGREFYMVNLMSFRSLEPLSDAMLAHQKYSKFILPLLLKYGGHPVLISDMQGRFIHPEGVDDWDQIAIVRYRSRRAFFQMVLEAARKEGGNSKWEALSKTQVFPSSPVIQLNLIRLKVFLILLVLFLLINRLLTPRSDTH